MNPDFGPAPDWITRSGDGKLEGYVSGFHYSIQTKYWAREELKRRRQLAAYRARSEQIERERDRLLREMKHQKALLDALALGTLTWTIDKATFDQIKEKETPMTTDEMKLKIEQDSLTETQRPLWDLLQQAQHSETVMLCDLDSAKKKHAEAVKRRKQIESDLKQLGWRKRR